MTTAIYARNLSKLNTTVFLCPRPRKVSCRAVGMDELKAKLQENQESAPRITPAEQVRTLLSDQKYGMISTMSSSGPTKGYPSGALMPYVVDDKGRVICCLSDMSGHKRCDALGVMSINFRRVCFSLCAAIATVRSTSLLVYRLSQVLSSSSTFGQHAFASSGGATRAPHCTNPP